MSEDATNLDRLHDLVLPPEVPWWPLAPGWYVVFGLVVLVALIFLYRAWKNWRANAYRRAALRELESAQGVPAIAELLRRTALAVAPRALVAELVGPSWLDWLAEQCPEPLPGPVREQLTRGVYGAPGEDREERALRDYAARWIAQHQTPQPVARPTPC